MFSYICNRFCGWLKTYIANLSLPVFIKTLCRLELAAFLAHNSKVAINHVEPQ